MDFDLFQKEKDVIEKAQSAISHNGGKLSADALNAFEVLLGEYQKLSKSTQRLIKLSDRNEQKLRDASDQIAHQKDELERRQEELVRAEKLASLGQLVSGVAHELNTPLGIILTSATSLQDDTNHLEKLIKAQQARKSDVASYIDGAKEIADILVRHSETASDLIQSFKAIAVDRHSDSLRQFNLSEFISDVVRSLSPSFKGRSIEIVCSIPKEIELYGYPGALNQVLTNLILNAHLHAFDEMHDHARIDVCCNPLQDRLKLCIKDNGRGIAAENRSRIFDPFFTTAKDRGGSGLGLHIVHNLVSARLQGEIKLRENDNGQGCCFELDLPLNVVEE